MRCFFFQDGLERSQHLSLPKVWEGPHGVAGSWLVDCCTQCMSGTAWCSQSHLLPCWASKHIFWPGPLPCWSLHGFHGGLPWCCLCRMVELPLIHLWVGCHCQWRTHHGSSSKILLLWGHDLVCQANHSGWVCALLRGWDPTVSLHWSWSGILGWRQTSIWHPLRGPAGSRCWSWKEGGWGHQPKTFPCLVCMWWPGHTAADRGASSGGMWGPLWDSSGWSSWGACGLSSWQMFLPYRYVWNFSQPYTMAKSSLSMLA